MAGLLMEIVEKDRDVRDRPGAAVAGYGSTELNPSWYLAILVGCTMSILLVSLPIARTSYFNRVSRRMFWHAMDYQAHMAGENCAVVIFGDSTATTGIDPLILERATGLRACNLAIPYMALASTGTRVLDDYLSRNPVPRLIVFAEHARHLRPAALDEDPGVIDGWLLADRALPMGQATSLFLRHPRLTMLFVEACWQQLFTLSPTLLPDLSQQSYRHDIAILKEHRGFFAMKVTEPPEQICGTALGEANYAPEYLADLQRRYETSQTRILLYASPVRDCDPEFARYQKITSLLGIGVPLRYGVSNFADAWHLDAQGAMSNSLYISELIQKTLATGDNKQGSRKSQN